MRFAFSAPTSSSKEQASLFTEYSSVGYDGLQLKRAQFQEFLGSPERFLDRWGNQPGIASGLIVGGDLDQSGIGQLRNAVEFASQVGSERIVFCHSRPREGVSGEDIRNFAKTLSELGKEAQSQGVNLSLHHHYNQPVMYREDFDIFFENVCAGAVGLTIDTAHLVKSGIDDIVEVVREFREFIDNFHLKDFASGEFRVLGEGSIDFDPVFGAIKDTDFDGWLCADEESGGDINQTLAHCYTFMRTGTGNA